MSHPDPSQSQEPVSLDAVLYALSHATRRQILSAIAEHNPRTEEEFEPEDFAGSDDELDFFKQELYHRHLPHLADAGFISWDPDIETITRGPQFEDVRPLIKLMHDHQDELPENWP